LFESWHGWVLVASTALCAVAAVVAPAMPQPLSYHDFADCRALFAIPNVLNVLSNLPFLLAGAVGLAVLLKEGGTRLHEQSERLAYLIFFLGAILTCLGSMYYHWAPDNPRLVWDRLPMTLGFAGLVSAMIAERIDTRLGARALWPLLAVGLFTVLFWYATERAGRGNVMPYGIFQGWTILVVIFLVVFFRESRYSHASWLWWPIALYALAKVAEALDLQIYRMGQVVSGHTVKHLLAAGAVYAVAVTLRRREEEVNAKAQRPQRKRGYI
jgi:hypothetical protein